MQSPNIQVAYLVIVKPGDNALELLRGQEVRVCVPRLFVHLREIAPCGIVLLGVVHLVCSADRKDVQIAKHLVPLLLQLRRGSVLVLCEPLNLLERALLEAPEFRRLTAPLGHGLPALPFAGIRGAPGFFVPLEALVVRAPFGLLHIINAPTGLGLDRPAPLPLLAHTLVRPLLIIPALLPILLPLLADDVVYLLAGLSLAGVPLAAFFGYALPGLLLILLVQLPVVRALFLNYAFALGVRYAVGAAATQAHLEISFFREAPELPVHTLFKVLQDLILADIVLACQHLSVLRKAHLLVPAFLRHLHNALHKAPHIEVVAVKQAGQGFAEFRLPHIRALIVRVVREVYARGESALAEVVPAVAEFGFHGVVHIHAPVYQGIPRLSIIGVRSNIHCACIIELVEKIAPVLLRIPAAPYHLIRKALDNTPQLRSGARRHREGVQQPAAQILLGYHRPRLVVCSRISHSVSRLHLP